MKIFRPQKGWVFYFFEMPGLFIKKNLLDVNPVRGVTSQKFSKNLPMLYVMGPLTPRVLPYSSLPQSVPGEHVVQPILGRTKHQAKQMVGKKVREDKSGYHFSLHR